MDAVTVADGEAAAPEGFVDFFRRYAKTWIHGVATAGLTAFGTLTIVHRWFAGLALAVYAVPPVALYLSRRVSAPSDSRGSGPSVGTESEDDGKESEPDSAADHHSDSNSHEEEWTRADTPVDVALSDATVTSSAAIAVGEDGTVIADDGEGWTVVLEDGPGADARSLHGADATSDGDAVWVAGAGGALARMESESGRHVDLSAPLDLTDAWTDVAVGGEAGRETVLLVDGSGEVVRGVYRDGEVAWTPPEKPGSGSAMSGADFADEAVGYLCDTNDGVFETVDGGESFDRVGIDGVDGTLTGVAALGRGDCLASADDGVVHRYDGARWTPDRVDEAAIDAIAGRDEYVVACGERCVHERATATGEWTRTATSASGRLRGVAVGVDRAVAVGDDGVVVERRR